MSEDTTSQRPLAGLRIVDAVRGPLASLTRYLAELGATVERIVAAEGDSVADAAANAGKWRLRIDMADVRVREALAGAHAIVADSSFDLDLPSLQAARPALVTMTVSDFGSDTSLSDWQATGPILHALSGELSRSGIRGRPPLLPPGDLAYQCAASQAAYVLVEALYRALRTGQGDHLDFSALDGAMQALDPGYGIHGSATLGRPAHLLSRDRPAPGFQYPITACADGQVRICLLAKRQWQGMFRWMGEPAAFASPDFEKMTARYSSPDLLPAIAAFFAPQTRAELERDAQQHGVPLASLLSFEECVAADHMREREAFAEVELAGGETLLLPNGSIIIDDLRMTPQPHPPQDATWPPTTAAASPFEGLRVLDLGIIVVGAEQSRLLGDGGADVVKVESRAYPDGTRQSHLSYGLSVSFAAGHRNKRSLGLNLRDPAGRALFLELAAKADVVLSNFKPGTLEALGIAYADLVAVNPRIIMAESSAFGSTGPWSGRMGYGPLVRAATGLTSAWRYPDDPQGYCDSVTVYPDHVAARIGAMSVVALLIRRLRTGRGGTSSIAQSEVMLAHFAADVARAAKHAATAEAPDAPWGVYRAAGDDEWCVITIRDDRDWLALSGLITVPGADCFASAEDRCGQRAVIDAAVGEWTSQRSATEIAETLQRHGIPAAPMLRVVDLPGFVYFRERQLFRVETHPYLQEDVIAERWPVKRRSETRTPSRPAPLAGEHSFATINDWLGQDVDVEALADAGILEPLAETTRAAAAGARAATPAIPQTSRAAAR